MVPDLRMACPACGERYLASKGRCPDCGLTTRRARLRQTEEAEAQVRAEGLGFGTEREAFRMGVVGGVYLLFAAGISVGISWLFDWDYWSAGLLAVIGVAAILHGIATGNPLGTLKRRRGGR